jgi:AcrR family transcriptional regulator
MASRSETYDRILQKADELFTRFGATKTPIADIARELRMSPANVYKFFPSKRALIEAVGAHRVIRLRSQLVAVTKTRKSAWERIEDLIRAVSDRFHNQIMEEEDLLEIEIMRRQDKWQFVAEFQDFLRAELVKLIRDGVRAGEMHVSDPEDSAAALLDCLIRAVEPLFLFEDPKAVRDQRLERQFRLLARALT